MQKLLLVDDTPLNHLDNVDIVTFPSSQLAFTWAVEHEPDLVITDYQMPSPNGLEFIAAIRKRNDDTPIVMLTASRERGSPSGSQARRRRFLAEAGQSGGLRGPGPETPKPSRSRKEASKSCSLVGG